MKKARCRLFATARENLLDDNHWTFAQTLFGITTYYRNEEDGSLSIKMEGRLEGVSLFDQVAVLREVDLHYKWAPFVSSSLTIAHLNKLDTVGWFVVGLPSFGLMRDACFRAVGCDSMLEDGSILLVGQGIADKPEDGVQKAKLQLKPSEANSIQVSNMELPGDFEYLSKDPILKELDLPAPPTRMGSGRMIIRKFQSIIHVESPTSAHTRLIANVDPNLPFVPQSLLDFLMKKLCGVLLNKLQNAAKKVSKDPIQNPHASKMRQEEEFYKNWLMIKFRAVCKLRNWTMPPVTSFELTDQQLELARELDEKKHKSKTNKTLRFYHSLSDDRLDHYLEEPDNTSEPAAIGPRSPKVRTLTEDSVISDISRNSSSTSSIWENNPISSYLREVEEKTQLRKAREIERARERAANRLKPKQLDEESRSRLQELREAQERRDAGIKADSIPHIPPESTKSQRKVIKEQHKKDWATIWTSHGFTTRVTVMFMLVTSLFIITYMDPIFEKYMMNDDKTFWGKRMQDVAAVAYMALSASVHFLLCYVALMYAFSALQIGSIAGREAKRFYSQNIHLVLALTSGAMVVLAILKASLIVFLRWLVWQISIPLCYSRDSISFSYSRVAVYLGSIVDREGSLVGGIMGAISNGVSMGLGAVTFAVTSLLQGTYYIMFQSNVFGYYIWKLLTQLMQPFIYCASAVVTFVESSIDASEGRMEVTTWREDAFSSTRFLLTHSGVFLLVLLTLYNLFARSARSKNTCDPRESSDELLSVSGSEDSKKGSPSVGLPGLQESSSGSPESEGKQVLQTKRLRGRNVAPVLSPHFDTIEEASMEGDAGHRSGSSSYQEPHGKKNRSVRKSKTQQ